MVFGYVIIDMVEVVETAKFYTFACWGLDEKVLSFIQLSKVDLALNLYDSFYPEHTGEAFKYIKERPLKLREGLFQLTQDQHPVSIRPPN